MTYDKLDLDVLPEDAKKELIDFYEYLKEKYGKKDRKGKIRYIIPRPIKRFVPLKRDEIYKR